MDMEGALRARLLAAAPVTALVAQRVTWIERPQKAALPGITLELVTDERVQNMTGFDGLQPGYVQIDVWAETYTQGRTLKNAIIDVLTPAGTFYGVRFTRAFATARDLSEKTDTRFVFRPSIDLTFFYSTTA